MYKNIHLISNPFKYIGCTASINTILVQRNNYIFYHKFSNYQQKRINTDFKALTQIPNKPDKVLEEWSTLVSQDTVDAFTFSLFAEYFKHTPQQVLKTFEQVKDTLPLNIVNYNIVLKACLSLKYFSNEQVANIYQAIITKFEKPNTETFNCLFRGFRRTKNKVSLENYVTKMKDLNILPNQHTYQVLIQAYFELKMFNMVPVILEEMKTNKIPHSLETYNTTLNGYARNNEWDKVDEIANEMKRQGFHFDVYTYRILIENAFIRNDIDLAESHFEKAIVAQEADLYFIYNTMITGYLDNQLPIQAKTIFSQMLQNNIRVTSYTCNLLIDGYFKNDLEEKVDEVFDFMRQKRIKLTLYTINSCISGYFKTGFPEKAANMMNALSTNSVAPNIVTYARLMKGYLSLANYQEIFKLEEEARNLGFKPTKDVYSILIKASKGDSLKIQGYLDEMEKRKMKFDPETEMLIKELMAENN